MAAPVAYLRLLMVAVEVMAFPIKAAVKAHTENSPEFRERAIWLAQWYHRRNTQLQRRLYGQAPDLDIRPLNEERAVTTAADLLGELVVFTVGGLIVTYEWQRSVRSEARKEENARAEREALRSRDEALGEEVEKLRARLEELERMQKGTYSGWLPTIVGGGKPAAEGQS